MTAKAKTALAAALLLAAAAPIIYQQQRIAALRGEVRSLQQQRAPVAALKKPPAIPAEERDLILAVSAGLPDLSGPPSPEPPDVSGPVMDVDALNRGKTAEKVAVLRERLSLTPGQETGIAKALEYGQIKFRISPPNVIPVKPAPEDLKKMEDAISAVLTADQQEEYRAFRVEEQANVLEAAANRELSRLQSMLTLSPEQKDQAFAVLTDIASKESALPVLDPDREAEAIREAERSAGLTARRLLAPS